jgi:hypothetical protein
VSLPAFSHYLPFWATRTVETPSGGAPLLVLVDGTIVVGFYATGADVFAADNGTLNRNAGAIRRALNLLPPDAFLQSDWRTGLDFADVVSDYAARGQRAPAVLLEQRRVRAHALVEDPILRRGRLLFLIGQRQALGQLAGHGVTSPIWVRAVEALSGKRRKDPYSITGDDITRAAAPLVEAATRIREELQSTGMKVTPLSEQALVSELHGALNPVTSKTIPAVIVDRPEELPPTLTQQGAYLVYRPLTLREQLPLGDLAWTEEHFTLDDPPLLHRTISLQRFPAQTRPDFMLGLQFSTSTSFRLVSTVVATDREKLTEQLITKRNRMQASSAGIVRNVAAEVALGEYERVLETMLTHDQKIFRTSVYGVVSGASHAELDVATRQLKEAFAEVGAVATTETGRQIYSFLSTLPGNGAAAPRQHTLITNTAADMVPYFSPSLGDKEAQLLYHTRQGTLRKLSFAGSKPNKNTLVLGGSGSGKSFNVANVFEQACLSEDGPVLVIDVQGPEVSNYRVLAELFGGTYTALSATADISFNPFFPHEEIILRRGDGKPAVDEEKVSFLKQLVAVMAVPNLAEHPKKALLFDIARTVILQAYSATKAKGRPPLLRDVVEQLQGYKPTQPEYEPLARDMFLQLQAWVKDPIRSRLLDRPSTFSSSAKFQVFDFFGLEKDKDLATVLLLSVSFYVWSTIQKYPRDVTKFVLFDECWKLLTHPVAAEIVAELYRTGRKWGASTWAITQNLNDFLNSPIHGALLANAATIFLNQHVTDHDQVGELCELNSRQLALFKGLRFKGGVYSELLLVDRAGNDASVLQLRPTAFDLWLNTTNPADVAFRDRLRMEKGLSLVEAIRFCAEHHPTGAPKPEARVSPSKNEVAA